MKTKALSKPLHGSHGERVCAVCGASKAPEGALPHTWDAHLVVTGVKASGGADTAMLLSCSAPCRAARGWPERKAGA